MIEPRRVTIRKPAVAWQKDQDYLQRLSPQDREWMKAFLSTYYDTNDDEAQRQGQPVAMRRERMRAYRAAIRDAHPQAGPLSDTEPGEVSVDPTPEYLNAQEYKDALAAYRDTLHQGLGSGNPHGRNPVVTPTHTHTKKKLERIVREAISQ